MNSKLFLSVVVLVASLITIHLKAQSDQDTKDSQWLYKEIVKMDSLLFNIAFNNCEMEVWEKIMSQDLEFYDDRTGLNTSRLVEIQSFKDRCAKTNKVTRKLVGCSVHELGEFGAVQLGEHDFYVDDKKVETAKFIHIWKKDNANWIVSRVVSYDHKPIE